MLVYSLNILPFSILMGVKESEIPKNNIKDKVRIRNSAQQSIFSSNARVKIIKFQ